MSQICIVFDRLRTEEKLLQNEVIRMGHNIKMMDAKVAQINTNSDVEEHDFGKVVIQRCISYFRGICFTACLEFLEIPVINKLEIINMCGNKLLTSLLLKKNNIPTPKTYFSFSREAAMNNIKNIGYPVVIKPIIGSWGRGVSLLKDNDTTEALLEIRDLKDGPYDRIYYLQELINRPPRDIRVITIDNNVIAAMYRRSSNNKFKTNIAQGALPEICKITNDLEDICIKTSKVIGGGILGIDLMEDKDKGLVVNEINNTVEFNGLTKIMTNKNIIPNEIIKFALNFARK